MDIEFSPVMRPPRTSWLAFAISAVQLWCFRLIKFPMGVGYVVVITEGLRRVVPALGMKLYNVPFLGAMKDFELWHNLDLAPLAAILLYLFSSSIWCSLLELWLYDDTALGAIGRQGGRYQQCMLVLGSIILFSDACLFYRAMTMTGWGGRAFSFTSLFCTLTYVAILVSVCLASVNLKRRYLYLKRGREPHGVMS
ncbi:MAG TPA: hypothetical protein VHC22_12955 [Pirellulales bacterium]|nr:hypothetical protein [Pirellulales bacterium]